jgi:hypothetical protein
MMIDQHEDILSLLVISFAIQELHSSRKGIHRLRLQNEQEKEKKNENISCESANIFLEKINEII